MTVTRSAAPTGHPRYAESLPNEPGSARTARSLVRTALAAWGIEHLTDRAELIISEFVGNTVEHARGSAIRAIVERLDQHTVRIAVADRDRGKPVPRIATRDDERGRGLAIVSLVADGWGVEPKRGGKVVWAVLRSEEKRGE
jgi:anti-sigma regulatory factor (Ser/Thr protein kinase)